MLKERRIIKLNLQGEDLQKVEKDIFEELEMSERRNHERWRILRDKSQEWYNKAEQEARIKSLK
jgi:hypothetical protein